MSLRGRLLLTLAGLLALALIVAGGTVVGLTRASLVEQLDQELRAPALDDFRSGRGPGSGGDPTGRRLALLLLDRQGVVVEAYPSGFARNPDPLPATALPGSDALPLGRIVTRPANSGTLNYRVLTVARPNGAQFIALAAPMREVDAVTRQLVVNLVAVSALVIGAVLVIGWLLIRHELRPLEQVTATADRISAGELDRRVGQVREGSEVGRLALAFDAMLDQIQAAFTQQQQALAAQARSEGRLRQFVADASHELRTPLTALRGYADLYQAGGLGDEAALEQAMRRIGTESRRMAELVEDLLLLARLDQGRPLRRDRVDLSALVRDAVDDARAIEPERPMSAALAADVAVTGDDDRLRQVVGNLLANVRVHTPPETAVEVRLARAGDRVRLDVVDHGPGIEPAHAEHIFDRFYRIDLGRSRDRGGSGLGLAIAAAVAAAHGGSISHSPTAGGGATFTLELPAA
ncbi:MAG TPA: ATP-binding protein [Candidatus Limnocylindrales bacterium]